jgi:HK97 family phage prohead protease
MVSFHTDTIELKSESNTLEGYITTSHVDKFKDLVSETCFKSIVDQINKTNITMDLEHLSFRQNGQTLSHPKHSIPVARINEAKQTDKGVWVRASLNQFHPEFKSIKGSIKDGFLHAFSIAYKPIRTMLKRTSEGVVRVLDDISLLNVTLTGNPVNDNARFELKSFIKMEDHTESIKKLTETVNTQAVELKAMAEKFTEAEKSAVELKSLNDSRNETLEKTNIELKSKVAELEKTVVELKSKSINKNTVASTATSQELKGDTLLF